MGDIGLLLLFPYAFFYHAFSFSLHSLRDVLGLPRSVFLASVFIMAEHGFFPTTTTRITLSWLGIWGRYLNITGSSYPFTYHRDIFSSPSLPGTVFKHSANHNPQDPSSALLYTILSPRFS